MKLSEFRILHQSRQVELLYRHGVYIGKKKLDGSIRVLYQLDSFYVELIYSVYRKYISRINSFSSVASIDAYLEEMEKYIPVF
jgi:hypothetical protein